MIISANLVGRDRADVGLGHLPDLLLERHSGDDRADAGVERGIRRRPLDWPRPARALSVRVWHDASSPPTGTSSSARRRAGPSSSGHWTP